MLHPLIKWAQRKDRVFLQVQLRDILNEKIQLSESTLTFQGQSDKKKYSFVMDFFTQIDKQQSKWTKTGFHLFFSLIKKNQGQQFWPRLTKNKQKNQYIQIDWQKWVDQDQQQQQGNKGLGDYDPSQMQNFNFGGMGGGMPGMGGMGGMPGMMPGMGGMMPGMDMMGGMGGMGDQDDEQGGQGNLDDLERQEEVQEQPQQE